MLDAQSINNLQVVLGITNLAELISSEEENTLAIPVLYTEDQKNMFGTNRFTDGKKAFGEIWTKDMKTKFPDVAYSGKDPVAFIEKFAEWKVGLESIEPEERITTLKDEVEELKGKLGTAQSDVEGIKSGYENKLFNLQMNQTVTGLVPDNTIIPRSHVVTLFNSLVGTQKDDDGKVFHTINGEVQKDSIGNYIETKEVVNTFLGSQKFIKEGGMDGGDGSGENGATYNTMSAFTAGMEKRGINPMSEEGQKILIKAKESKEFDINS